MIASHNNQKKIAVVNDFSGFGRCSIAVSLPIISAMKIQCCPVPTSIFSNHTGFDSYFFEDYTDKMRSYIAEWRKLNLHFNGICTGFLGSEAQIGIVSDFLQEFGKDGTIVLIDPVMGDYGKPYPTYTMEKMCETLLLLRTRYHFNGYIHVKTIPGASDELLAAAGYLADRISVNLELPTETALRSLAPNKTMQNILNPMGKVQSTIASHRIATGKSAYMDRNRGNQFLRNGIFSDDSKKTFREKLNMQNTDAKPGNNPPLKKEDPNLISRDKNKFTKHILTWENACQLAPLDMSDLKRNFAPAGQSTQMIIGATGESDYTLLQTSQALYQGFDLKRVFYSAYIPLNDDSILPQIGTPPPLLREHRLYQADWLLRFYGFQADELLSESQPNFNELLDPKCDWALRHLEHFPVEVEKASYATLLRVPGIGPKSASRITYARQYGRLNFDNLKRMGVVLKRAHYFITCGGRQMYRTPIEEAYITRQLVQVDAKDSWKVQHSNESYSQMTLADFGIG